MMWDEWFRWIRMRKRSRRPEVHCRSHACRTRSLAVRPPERRARLGLRLRFVNRDGSCLRLRYRLLFFKRQGGAPKLLNVFGNFSCGRFVGHDVGRIHIRRLAERARSR